MEYSRGAFVRTGWLIVAGFWFSSYWAARAPLHRRTRSSSMLSASVTGELHNINDLPGTIKLVDECVARMRALFNANLRLRQENLALVGQLRFLAQCRGTYLSAYWSSIRGSVERSQMRIGVHDHADQTEETLDIFRRTAARLHYLVHSARLLAAQNDELSRRLQLWQGQHCRGAESILRPVPRVDAPGDPENEDHGNDDDIEWCWYLSRCAVLVISGLGLHLVWTVV